MKRKNNLLAFCFVLLSALAFGQMDTYNLMRPINGVSDQWHSVLLPQMVVSEMQNNLRDVRIYGIANEIDTVEVPYILREEAPKYSVNNIAFTTLNTTKNQRGYFYTFSLDETDPINQIALKFGRKDFDWRIKLEGSQDQAEWFTVVDNYRILSIHSDQIDFDYTTLSFPESQFKYFRIRVNATEEPDFKTAEISQIDTIGGSLTSYSIKTVKQSKRKSKNTTLDVKLENPSRISTLEITVNDDFDFYRPISIRQLIDSTETETGWRYSYSNIYSGTLNSLRPNSFSFSPVTASNLRIVIENGNNQPLEIGAIKVTGYENKLIARFTQKADYFLVYGKDFALNPKYDIARFEDNIPSDLTELTIGEAIAIPKKAAVVVTPLFENKVWLWVILLAVVALLGVFTLKMMKAKE